MAQYKADRHDENNVDNNSYYLLNFKGCTAKFKTAIRLEGLTLLFW